MNKSTAKEIVQEFLIKKEFSWEAIYHLDEEPIETDEFWIFKNLWEPSDPRRGNDIIVDSFFLELLLIKNQRLHKK